MAAVCDRTRVSDRAAAMICRSLIKDTARSSEETKDPIVIDMLKIRRERSKTRESLRVQKCPSAIKGLYFDGRKD